MARFIRWFGEIGREDVPLVGGKNASLGEMTRTLASRGIRVPEGFAVTAEGYRRFIEANGLAGPIEEILGKLQAEELPLPEAGRRIRELILGGRFPPELEEEILEAYRELGKRVGRSDLEVAVRSSATAEDLPEASFAGQHESYLNVSGGRRLLEACRRCYASLYTDRAIAYREEKGFDHARVYLSLCIQRMVRADLGGAGILFTLDPETGFPGVVVINAVWGLGETAVKGLVNPDEYIVFKPLLHRPDTRPLIWKATAKKEVKLVYSHPAPASHPHPAPLSGRATATPPDNSASSAARAAETLFLTPVPEEEQELPVLSDEEVLTLARWGQVVEEHYGKPMDIEWARDGVTGELFVVQARPETVHSVARHRSLVSYALQGTGRVLLTGASVGQAIAAGRVRVVTDPRQAGDFPTGSILVARQTDPDWVPLMRRAGAVVTDFGGRTCHAAIVSRELGVPAVVGTEKATRVLADGQEVTVSCAEGAVGKVYEGMIPFERREVDPGTLPSTRTRIMINLADPASAFQWWWLPAAGVGLARMEFVIAHHIKVHPMALLHPEAVADQELREEILDLAREYTHPGDYFVERLAQGIARLAAPFYPHPVIVRFSDFKSNEYAGLLGGQFFEPQEENPMLGFRGARRYYDPRYREAFGLECRAIRRVREEMGLDHVAVMVPFCRTPEEADRVLEAMAEHGLRRGERGLEVYVMCELPSNVILAGEFARRFDGFSIGSNDLTQLVLGVDRDSPLVAEVFDERNEAVKRLIRQVIVEAHRAGRKVGICGQAPSDYPDFVDFLVEAGIDSISVNPDSFITVCRRVAEAERRPGG